MMNVQMIVSGRVQGVGFRYSVRRKALGFGLVGWVKNNDDGTVRIEVEGNEQTIERFIQEIKTNLHALIRIDHIDVMKSTNQVGYQTFSIK